METNTEFNLVLRSHENSIINEFKTKGTKLVNKNPFFKDLSEIMTDNKVKSFFDKYFKTMDDIKTTVIYMKLFRLFQAKYNELSQKELENNVNIYLLHHVMTNNDLRKTLIKSTIEHLEDNRKPILAVNSDLLKEQRKKLRLCSKMEELPN